jgi:exodeoxyribonuclease V alpha subunit
MNDSTKPIYTPPISANQLSDIVARLRAKAAVAKAGTPIPYALETELKQGTDSGRVSPEHTPVIQKLPVSDNLTTTDRFGNQITYNDKQNEAVKLGTSGKSMILIGPAGTGKTTSMKGVVDGIIQSGKAPILHDHDHKFLPQGTPGIVICAYTRRATNNIRNNLSEDMKGNCLTIHKLLEYEPVYYDVIDNEGNEKTTMRFEPTRHRGRPLPQEIHTIIFEESSMISVELHKEVEDALSHSVQFIYLGDIQQLPPVFGSAILGFKMLELPTVELTEVYRQALESPIIKLAHRILSGKPIPVEEYKQWHYDGQLKLHDWKKKISADNALLTLARYFAQAIDEGHYDPDNHGILIPFNKSCGTDELNKHIANHIARKHGRVTWEIIAGFNKHYFSIGDKVLYDKEDAVITNIYRNPSFAGKTYQDESQALNYWGHISKSVEGEFNSLGKGDDEDIDFLLSTVAAADSDEDRLRVASHVIEVSTGEDREPIRLDTAKAINNLSLGYAITVHKSQGSEWEKVFLLIHQSHSTMIQRELLYTAVTRAKKELFCICEPDTFTKGILNQRIKGNTLAEKAEFFKGKIERMEVQNGK